jgi:hypothetical protein
MTSIIKTWPANMPRSRVLEVFTHDWGSFYFTLGRGLPRITPDTLFFTHRGRILGHFKISEIVRNEGQLPKLRSLFGETSEWQIRRDAIVAICDPPFVRLEEKLFYAGFRGFRYFDLDSHRGSLDSKIML